MTLLCTGCLAVSLVLHNDKSTSCKACSICRSHRVLFLLQSAPCLQAEHQPQMVISSGQSSSHSCPRVCSNKAAECQLGGAPTNSTALRREEGGDARDTERGPLLRNGRDSSVQRNGQSQEARQRDMKAGKAMPELTLPQCLVCTAPIQTDEYGN